MSRLIMASVVFLGTYQPIWATQSGCKDFVLQLTQKPLSQRNKILTTADLTDKDNMLCGPTCIWNLMSGLEDSLGVKFQRSTDLVSEFSSIAQLGHVRPKGGRNVFSSGMGMWAVYQVLQAKIEESQLPLEAGWAHARGSDDKNMKIGIDDIASPSRVSLLSYVGLKKRNQVLAHWLLVKEVNRKEKIITVLDPWDAKLSHWNYSVSVHPESKVPTLKLKPIDGPNTKKKGLGGLTYFAQDVVYVDVASDLVPKNKSNKVQTKNDETIVFQEGKITSRFIQLFQTSGFENIKKLELVLRKSGGKAAELLSRLKDEKIEIVIYHSVDARNETAEQGFSTFFQTGKTMGDNGRSGEDVEDALHRRERIEASYLNLTLSDYRKIPQKNRFKYGILRQPLKEMAEDFVDPLVYGKDAFVLKMGNIRNRLTLTMGDSIDRLRYIRSASENNFSFEPQSWDQALIPWEARSIIIPEILPYYEKQSALILARKVEPKGYATYFKQNGLLGLLKYRRSLGTDILNSEKTFWANSSRYVEAQVRGALDLNDVAAFEFRTLPPSGKFLEALRAHGIEIRDARTWPPQIW